MTKTKINSLAARKREKSSAIHQLVIKAVAGSRAAIAKLDELASTKGFARLKVHNELVLIRRRRGAIATLWWKHFEKLALPGRSEAEILDAKVAVESHRLKLARVVESHPKGEIFGQTEVTSFKAAPGRTVWATPKVRRT